MAKQNFKGMTAAVAAGIVVSVIIIACVCVIPKRITLRMSDEISPLVSDALNKALSEKNSEATPVIESIFDIIEGYRRTLMLFYDHKDVSELVLSAKTALELSRTDDTAQLITELCDIEKAADYILHINDMSIFNIF